MTKILGIDLGTTNSAVAVVKEGEPKIIENSEGNRTMPSMVAVSKSGDRLVGLLAKRQAVTNPLRTIFSVKRFIGRRFSDKEVAEDKKVLPYEMRESANGGVEVKMADPSTNSGQAKWYRPEEISAMVLGKLKKDAEDRLGEKIEEAIITVPAYFDDSQRKATKDAGEIAGINVKRILNEPTAAALAYGLNKNKDEKIAVYDFGGGTFDVSVLEVEEVEGGGKQIDVKATNGDTHLGGDDIDQRLINYLVEEFKKTNGVDVSRDQLALQRLKDAAEKAKHELSSTAQTDINVPFLTADASGPKHFEMKMSRAKLESLVQDLIDRSIKLTADTVRDAGFEIKDINEIILVGGQTRMPAIVEAVKNLFGREPHKDINPDEVVAIGAAVQGEVLAAQAEGRMPEGEVKDVLLLDVTPLSLGIETLGGVSTKVIEKNTTVPVSRGQVFSTAADNQTQVEIHILQGEREMASDNKTLGRFILDGIPPAPRGMPQVEVSFDIDANGILNVKAKDKASGKEQSIRIEASSGLSKEDVEKMKRDAELHADEDRKKRELIDVRNTADALIYTAEKSIKDAGDKVGDEIKRSVESAVSDLKKIKDTAQSADEIKKASENLSSALSKIGEAMQKGQNNAKPGESPGQDNAEKKDGGENGGDVKDIKSEDIDNKN